MTKPRQLTMGRILAIAPSCRGFGYAVLEPFETLVDWGVKSVGKDKNIESLAKVEELLSLYLPNVLVLEDTLAKGTRRNHRIKELNEQISAKAAKKAVLVALLAQPQIKQSLLGNTSGTKYEIACLLAAQFPEELGRKLPPRRKPWMSVDYRMDIFDALALAVSFQRSRQKKR